MEVLFHCILHYSAISAEFINCCGKKGASLNSMDSERKDESEGTLWKKQ